MNEIELRDPADHAGRNVNGVAFPQKSGGVVFSGLKNASTHPQKQAP